MKSFLDSHNVSFRSEWLKLKRTGTFWLCIAAAAIIPLVITLVSIFISKQDHSDTAWSDMIRNCLQAFTGFFFPLFLVITMVRIVYVEHRSDTWKLMETQPVSRLSLYVVKYEVAILVSFLCLLCLFIFALLGGVIMQFAKPEIGFQDSSVAWGQSFKILFRYWIASLGLIAIQYFLALLIRSFAWPMTIGLTAVIVGAMLAGFNTATWFPYSAPVLTTGAYEGGNAGSFLIHHEKLSIAWALLFLFLGYMLFTRRSFVKAFFTPMRQLATFLAAIIVFALLFWWINTPVELSRYGKTIVEGKLSLDKPVSSVLLIRAPAFDTVLSAPVKNGKFRMTGPVNLAKGIYYLKSGANMTRLYFGGGDSIYIDLSSSKNGYSLSFGGTRMAENEYLKRRTSNYYLENYGYRFTPHDYAATIMDEWKESVKGIEHFKTVDNIKPSADFIALQKKLNAVYLLNLTEIKYPQIYSVYHPNEKLEYPKILDRLRKELRTDDSTLVGSPEYIQYNADLLKFRSQQSTNPDSAFYTSVNQIASPAVREAVIFNEAQKKTSVILDSARRSSYLAALMPYIQNPVYRNAIAMQVLRMNNLQRGKKAPEIEAEALSDKSFMLSNLRGRYVVIDVWATWCGPCKRESPYFEQYAERYTNENVAFVSLSIDDDKNAWKMDAPQKSKIVLQLWAKNGSSQLDKSYAINTIPRFLLIDPKGNILNAQLPSPSDPEFDNILRKEIPFLSQFY